MLPGNAVCCRRILLFNGFQQADVIFVDRFCGPAAEAEDGGAVKMRSQIFHQIVPVRAAALHIKQPVKPLIQLKDLFFLCTLNVHAPERHVLPQLVDIRRVRNMVFMFRDREYNLASRCLGTPLWRVLTKNILPYLVSVIILRMALSIPATINLESTLSYLGIGLGIETPSLGLILSKVRGFFLDYPYLLVFPASIVSIISISFYIMGNAFSDAADPRNHV